MARFIQLNQRLDELLNQVGRSPKDVRRSIMKGCIFAKNKADLEKKLSQRRHSFEEYRQNGNFIGDSIQVADQIAEFEETGASEIMLQWLDLDDLDGLEQLAKAVLK
jgi:alkanesulfonate monooxygenase SsuD/methylene tetrahydromethanopterin reductase-like flavin-dependent oxidoreductase (luciferase family)